MRQRHAVDSASKGGEPQLGHIRTRGKMIYDRKGQTKSPGIQMQKCYTPQIDLQVSGKLQRIKLKRSMSLPLTRRDKQLIHSVHQSHSSPSKDILDRKINQGKPKIMEINQLRQQLQLPSKVMLRLKLLNPQSTVALSGVQACPLLSDKLILRKSEQMQQQREVTVDDIVKGGLNPLLKSNVPLAYFLAYLIRSLAPENLLFYLAVARYQNELHLSPSIQAKQARKICKMFFEDESSMQLNLNQKVVEETKAMIRASFDRADRDPNAVVSTHRCFDPAVKAVKLMLEDSYRGFKKDELFQKMVNDLADTAEFSDVHRSYAYNVLKQSLKGLNQDPAFYPVLMAEMAKFCRDRLNLIQKPHNARQR
ncbi:hypothetical protein MIR68_001416 [Amoeboaphelidium protococcarum]|nr:hypothetical protein MIR68_001416 [Amoeboaphelidium protococcarum]